MSDLLPGDEEDLKEYEDDDRSCDYGFEFCSDPETKALGLCTTECEEYLRSIEEDNP